MVNIVQTSDVYTKRAAIKIITEFEWNKSKRNQKTEGIMSFQINIIQFTCL